MNNSLLQDVIAISHQVVAEKDYVSAAAVSNYEQKLRKSSTRAENYLAKELTSFDKVKDQAQDVTLPQMDEFSKLLASDALVANAVRFAENAQAMPSPKQQIADAMGALREDLKNAGMSEQAINEQIAESLKKIVISMTHTAHPTIFHTLAAKRFQQNLIAALEAEGNTVKDLKTGAITLSEKGKEVVGKLYKDNEGFIAKLASGAATITQMKQVTVEEEAAMERDNWEAISKQIQEVIDAWNQVHKGIPQLQISKERAKTLFEKRTWLRSADADGRHLATTEFLYKEIMRDVKDKKYTGEVLDPRQNSQVHKDLMGSLVQVKFRNSSTERFGEDERFEKFCVQFMNDRIETYRSADAEKNRWDKPENSIFQQLTPEHQAEFVAEMMQAKPPFKLLPEGIKTETLDVLENGQKARKEILEKYKAEIQQELGKVGSELHKKYAERLRKDPEFYDIEYADMVRVTIPFNGKNVSLRGLYGKWLGDRGFRQGELEIEKNRYNKIDKNANIDDIAKHYTLEDLQCERFLQKTRKWNAAAGKQVEITPAERDILLGTTKRMTVLNEAIDNLQGKVADRYQIANFEKPADFLIALKLFEETGLAENTNGKITNAKLDIMPLLETETDLKNAKNTFEDLLTNSKYKELVTSYWKQRGKATIMLGFSDGSASAGNFASQWAIYKATRDLSELFAKHGIDVEFFEGRGRGTDRGGTLDPSLRFDLMPPEVTCKGRYDVTIQSDLPMDLAASPAYGTDYLTKILTNTVKYHVQGKETREYLASLADGGAIKERNLAEKVLDTIAEKSSDVFNKLVRGNPAAYEFLINIYDNNDRTSRVPSRMEDLSKEELQSLKIIYKKSLTTEPLSKEEKEKLEILVERFDKIRAIQKEYRINGIDHDVYFVGLKEGMYTAHTDFGANSFSKAVKHPFFQAFSNVAKSGLRNFDPEIAESYGSSMGKDVEKFITSTCASVSGALRDINLYTNASNIRKATDMSTKKTDRRFDYGKRVPVDTLETHTFSNSLDQFAHALTLQMREVFGITKPEPKTTEAAISRRLLFVNAQEVNKLTLEPVRSQNVGIAV